ncbi:MAG: TIGR00296 family protein [Planctomycetota bacterium]
MSKVHSTILTEEECQQLLHVSRASAVRHFGGEKRNPDLKETIRGHFGGVFVSFWRERALRGCVGTFQPTENIVGQVEAVTISSLADPRFVHEPITPCELAELCIELSVISGFELVSDLKSIKLGVHGIVVRQAESTGCFLPKVAAEHGWSTQEFLSNCCVMKAGLPADAWGDPRTEIYRFTAMVFGEESKESRVDSSCR